MSLQITFIPEVNGPDEPLLSLTKETGKLCRRRQGRLEVLLTECKTSCMMAWVQFANYQDLVALIGEK